MFVLDPAVPELPSRFRASLISLTPLSKFWLVSQSAAGRFCWN